MYVAILKKDWMGLEKGQAFRLSPPGNSFVGFGFVIPKRAVIGNEDLFLVREYEGSKISHLRFDI